MVKLGVNYRTIITRGCWLYIDFDANFDDVWIDDDDDDDADSDDVDVDVVLGDIEFGDADLDDVGFDDLDFDEEVVLSAWCLRLVKYWS